MSDRLKPGAMENLKQFAVQLDQSRAQTEPHFHASAVPAKRPNLEAYRTIRRSELRRLVPLSDTTIYELERKGEFPKRFYLTPRCVVWSLSDVLRWIEGRKSDADRSDIARPDVHQRAYRPVGQPRTKFS